MRTCTKHAHSSPATAADCYAAYMQRKADRIMRWVTPGERRMNYYDPPLAVVRENHTLYIFAEDSNTRYS